MMSEYTKEPWFLAEEGFAKKGLWSAPTVYAADDELRYIAVCACADQMNFYSATNNLANARRIVAAINCLVGYTTEEIETGAAVKNREIAEIATLLARVERLEGVLKWMLDQEQYTFAECSLAEEIMSKARQALSEGVGSV